MKSFSDTNLQMIIATKTFAEAGFKPTKLSLDRTIENGKSFNELIKSGSSGKEIAEKLICIETHGAIKREKLNNMLSDRPYSRPEISDMVVLRSMKIYNW